MKNEQPKEKKNRVGKNHPIENMLLGNFLTKDIIGIRPRKNLAKIER